MPEVRIDPLSGYRTIVASDRASRPGGGLSATAPDPIDTEKDPFLEGHEDRTPPETYALRADGSGAGHARLARARRAQPLPGARPRQRLPEPVRQARPLRGRPRARRARGRRQRARPGHLAGRPRGRAGRRRARRVAPADAHAHRERRRLRARHRQRAPRGRRVAAPHARADLRAGLRPRRRGPRARALRRLRAAHDGRQPAAGPRPGGGQAARPDRRHRRRGGPHGPLRRAAALPAHARAARAARPLRGRRPHRRRAAARRPAAAWAASSATSRR